MAKPTGFDSGFGPGFGVGRYYYGLTQFLWETNPFPHWRLPASVVGVVDLRTLPQQAAAGGAPQGFAFVASMQPIDVLIARSLHFSEENMTSLMQDTWEAELGFRPQGAKVVDLLWDMLTSGSDPDGQTACKPLMPGVDSLLKLFVGGHSLVKQESFRFGLHPHTGRVRSLLQRQFERDWERTNGSDHCLRCLDFTCKKYRVDDWKEFVPPRLHGHVPGRLPHATTRLDNFNRSDGAIGSSSEGWSWDVLAGTWVIASNQLRKSADVNTNQMVQAGAALSSADHYSQIATAGAFPDRAQRSICRMPAATAHGYVNNNYSSTQYLSKFAPSETSLATVGQAYNAGDIYKVEADGSTIKAYVNGGEVLSVTDTSLASGTYCGIMQYEAAASGTIDDFEAADLAAGGVTGDVPVVLIEVAALAPATQHAATTPTALVDLLGIAPTTAKTTTLGTGTIRVSAGQVTAQKVTAVQVARAEVVALVPTTQHIAATQPGLVKVSGVELLSAGEAAVQVGLIEVSALAFTTSKFVAVQQGLVEVRALSPEPLSSVEVLVGLVTVSGTELTSLHSAAVPVGLVEVIGVEPAADASGLYTIVLTLAHNDDDAAAQSSPPPSVRTNLASTNKEAGFRFVGAEVLAGMSIESAILRLTAVGEFVENVHNKVMLEAADAADQFTSVASYTPFAARPTTDAKIDWDPPDGMLSANTEFDSPDVSDAVQEVTDREGYGGVLHVLLKFDDGGFSIITHFHRDGSVAKSAKLIVVYSVPEEFALVCGVLSIDGTRGVLSIDDVSGDLEVSSCC